MQARCPRKNHLVVHERAVSPDQQAADKCTGKNSEKVADVHRHDRQHALERISQRALLAHGRSEA